VTVYIVLGTGFEEIEAIAPADILRRGGVAVTYVGLGSMTICGAHGISVSADALAEVLSAVAPDDMIVIPGGTGGVDAIIDSSDTMALLEHAKTIGVRFAAICAGPKVLAKLGMLAGKTITCYPGCEADMTGANVNLDKSVVQDGELITARAPGSALDFGLKLLEKIKGSREAENVRSQMYYDI